MEQKSNIDTIAEWLLLSLIAFLPILAVPLSFVPFQFTKTFFLFVCALLAFMLVLFRRLRDGVVVLPKHPLFWAVWGIPFAYVTSAIFSSNIRDSLMGISLETDTAGFFVIGAILLFLAVILFRTKTSHLRVYLALLVSFAVLALFQGLRFAFGPDFLSFGIFSNPVSNLLGRWNDLAIFFGLVSVFSLVSMEVLSVSRAAQILLGAVFFVSLFFLCVVNFSLVWIIVGLFSFSFLVHNLVRGRFHKKEAPLPVSSEKFARETHRGTLILAAILFLFSMAFLVWGGALGDKLAGVFHTTQLDARPSWQSTIRVTNEVYVRERWLGSGPNTFAQDWNLYRPAEVNATAFWNADFSSAVGTVPTAFVTAGLIGGAAWILFFLLFLYAGFRALVLSSPPNRFAFYLTLSSYLGALYLWLFSVFYTPGQTLVAFAFLLTGVFIASLRGSDEWKELQFSFSESPRASFVFVLLVSLVLLASVGSLFLVGQKYLAALYFERSLVAANVNGNLEEAEMFLGKALSLDANDRYLRVAAEENLVRLSKIFSDTSLPQGEARSAFQQTLTRAVENALSAAKADPRKYQNWMTVGRVYQSVVPLKIPGAHENAAAAFGRALVLNPQSPAIPLALARLSVVAGDNMEARRHIADALLKKRDYTDAVFLLSQIEIGEGKMREAILSTEAATVLDPRNPVIFFQLGLLRYGMKDIGGAVQALEEAVRQNDSYANARYYLGLAYYQEGRTEDSIAQFKRVWELNPDNADVKNILKRLYEGLDPLSSSQEKTLKNTTTPPITNE